MTLAGGLSLAASLGTRAHAQGSDAIRVGLVGCGGRGMGALKDAINHAENCVATALADVFSDQAARAAENIQDLGDRNLVTPERTFSGFAGVERLFETDVDYVIVATPGKFHPYYAKMAVEAGKHVFAEKPGGVDAPGVRMLMDAGKLAATNGTGFASGTQRRHDPRYIDIMKRIQDGAIGEVLGGSIAWCNNNWQYKPRREAWATNMEYMLRNWRPHIWLSGDLPLTLMVHNADIANWFMGGPPEKVVALGGRIMRDGGPEFGNIYDHFSGEYTYSGGRIVSAMTKSTPVVTRVSERVVGSAGVANPAEWIRPSEGNRYVNREGRPSPHRLVHVNFINSIRAGTPLNEAQQLAEATLTAIMFRESAYTGEEVTWDFVLNQSQATHGPDPTKWIMDDTADEAVPRPGTYALS